MPLNKREQKLMERCERLLPNGIPRYVKCFDNEGKTIDRYTVIFTGRFAGHLKGIYFILGMSAWPFHPQGFGQHGELEHCHVGKHLGKRIKFQDLPADCQKLVLDDYKDYWNLNPTREEDHA